MNYLNPMWWIREFVYRIRTRRATRSVNGPAWVDVTHLVSFEGGGPHIHIRYGDGAETDHEVTKVEMKMERGRKA